MDRDWPTNAKPAETRAGLNLTIDERPFVGCARDHISGCQYLPQKRRNGTGDGGDNTCRKHGKTDHRTQGSTARATRLRCRLYRRIRLTQG
jgi:hypothetical protein